MDAQLRSRGGGTGSEGGPLQDAVQVCLFADDVLISAGADCGGAGGVGEQLLLAVGVFDYKVLGSGTSRVNPRFCGHFHGRLSWLGVNPNI